VQKTLAIYKYICYYITVKRKGDETMENLKIKKLKGIQGFIGTTYAVYENGKLLKIFINKKDAENFVK
jgi:hypothetical protein